MSQNSPDIWKWTNGKFDRRSFLQLAAAVGATPASDELNSKSEAQQSDPDEYTVAPHDHSDESRGGDTLKPTDLATERTPLVDVTAHGVVGDGEKDDAAAFQRAADKATPHGVLYVPYDVVLHFEETVDIDLSGAGHNRFALLCQGVLNPGEDLGKAIHLHGGVFPYVNLRIVNGGKDIESDTACWIEDTVFGLFEGRASGYAGRVFHLQDAPINSIGTLFTASVGQGLAIHGGAGHAEIRDVWEANPVRAPEFVDCADVCINQYENYMGKERTERGILFKNCLSTWADKIAVGGNADTPPAEFRDCRHAFVKTLHLGGSPTWGGVIDNVRFSTFRIFCNVNQKGVKYTGSGSNANRLILNGQNLDQKGIVVTEDVEGYHYVSGNIAYTGALAVEILTSEAEIHLDHFYAEGNLEGDLSVVPDNEVHLSGCRIGSMDGQPKTLNGIGTAAADAERPDRNHWSVGHRVEFVDTGDGSGTGYYERTPDGWRQLGVAAATEATSTHPRSPATKASQELRTDSTTQTAPGFDMETGLLALAGIGVAALARLRDEDSTGES